MVHMPLLQLHQHHLTHLWTCGWVDERVGGSSEGEFASQEEEKGNEHSYMYGQAANRKKKY
jgi:hypothetical protein